MATETQAPPGALLKTYDIVHEFACSVTPKGYTKHQKESEANRP